jgi:DNA recombination protein RmuC
MDVTTALAMLVTLLVGGAAGFLLARARTEERIGHDAVVRDGLDRLQDQLQDLHAQRHEWQGELRQQVDTLRRETSSLSTALRRPQVRGRWGELHLRRTVEIAGLVDRCDFDEQVTLRGPEDQTLRPDLVVHLAGGRDLVVDSKVPLDAFLDATECDDEDERAAHLARHARQLTSHVDALAGKSYWRSLPGTPELVVLFVPGEAFLAAALESRPGLIEHAAAKRVVLATPTTLIALLRTVAHGWSQQALADKAQEVHRLGRELHERLGVLGSHLDRVGRSLGSAVAAYNQAVGSLETRVLVSARRFTALEVTDQDLEAPRPVDAVPRPPTADELVQDVRSGLRRPLGVAPEETG